MTSQNVRFSGVPLACLWLSITLAVGIFFPVFSERQSLWLQAILPPFIGVVGGWISLHSFGGSSWQRLLATIAFLLWVLFLFGWGWSVYARR